MGDQDRGAHSPTVTLPNVQISGSIQGTRTQAPTVLPSLYQMSKYLAQYRGPGHRHPQSNRHPTKCLNIWPNTGDQDTGTHSPPATVANVQISGQIQGTRIEAPTVQLSLYQMSKYPAQYRGPGHRHPQYNRHSTKCPNIRPNTGDQDTGTRSPSTCHSG